MTFVHGATLCFESEISKARVLASSFLDFHPGSTFTILLLDSAGVRTYDGKIDCWELKDLSIGNRQIAAIVAGLDGDTDVMRARPWLVSSLLDMGRSPLVLLECSTLVTHSLQKFASCARVSGAAVVPRILEPIRPSGAASAEIVLKVGVIEPGIIALVDGPRARELLRWWKAADFTTPSSPRLLDVLPAFGHAVVRDPGLGLSRWNLIERPMTNSAMGPLAGGSPVKTISFTHLETAELGAGIAASMRADYFLRVRSADRLMRAETDAQNDDHE